MSHSKQQTMWTDDRPLACLTVCQPWAWAIIHGEKRYENRTWQMHYRGPLLIHAGKSRSWISSGMEFLRRQDNPPAEDEFDFGAIIGRVQVIDCLPVGNVDDRFADGPWCIKLGDPQPLSEPIPCTGRQGLFRVPATLLRGARFL